VISPPREWLATVASADVYDPATNSFSPTAGPSTARLIPNVATLADGRVLAADGITTAGNGTATNGLCSSHTSTASTALTPTAPDTTPPSIRITKLSSKLKLKAFLKGISTTITPNEPSTLDIALLASARSATIAKVYNLTLAGKTFSRGGNRKVTLRPNRKLVRRAKKFSVILRVIVADRVGNRRIVTNTIQIKPERAGVEG